jgi:hypothetical protein
MWLSRPLQLVRRRVSWRDERQRRPRRSLAIEPLEARSLLDATTLLIGTWNVDIADLGYRPAGFPTVLAALGAEYAYYGTPQPPDVLTITETRSNARTGATADTEYLTQILNDLYGSGTYDHGIRNGFSNGGGTEGVIYNTQTVQLLEETAVGFASTSGPARQELRYLFRPVVIPDGSADFYVYVGHYKAGSTTTDRNRRTVEAQQVRADADALGPGVHILYTGDFNCASSNEPAEQTLLASGNGQAFDPISRLGTWQNNPAFVDIDTIAATALGNRYDLLWETAPVIGDNGLQALPATYHTVGNNGSVPLRQSVASPGNTALSELANQADVLDALANTTSDHLPVMQEYQIVTGGGAGGDGAGNMRGSTGTVPLPLLFAVSTRTDIRENGGHVSEPIQGSFPLAFDEAGVTGHEAGNGSTGATVITITSQSAGSFPRSTPHSTGEDFWALDALAAVAESTGFPNTWLPDVAKP